MAYIWHVIKLRRGWKF